jgi:hypothetical protein
MYDSELTTTNSVMNLTLGLWPSKGMERCEPKL